MAKYIEIIGGRQGDNHRQGINPTQIKVNFP